MKLLVDAHLPRRLADRLRTAGHDAVHTLDLPDGNRTTDEAINDLAELEDRIVVTKDSDFVDSYHLNRRPPRLLLISTGNISNVDLEALFVPLIPAVDAAFANHTFLELARTGLIVHA